MTSPDLYLFVSHVTEDRAAALQIVGELERRGVRCWIAPRNVRAGNPFDDEIAEAIDNCRAMLLIFSERCNDSPYIRREVTVAGEANKIVIPFRIENAQPKKGLRVRLADLHWIDAFVAREQAIDEVLKTLAPVADKEPPAHPIESKVSPPQAVQAEQQRGRALRTDKPPTPPVPVDTTVAERVEADKPVTHVETHKPPAAPLTTAEEAPAIGIPAAETAPASYRSLAADTADDRHATPSAQDVVEQGRWPPSRRTALIGGAAAAAVGLAGAALWLGSQTRGRTIRTFTGHSAAVLSVAFSPDGRAALSASADKTLKLWDVATGKTLRTFSGHSAEVRSVAFSPDGRTGLSGSEDKTLKLWDVATGGAIRTFTGHLGGIFSVAFAPNGRAALSGSWDEAKLWDIATGNLLHTFSGHSGPVYTLAFSPDGRTALSGALDGTLKLWEVASGNAVRTFAAGVEIYAVAFGPSGRTALVGGFDIKGARPTMTLWAVATGDELRTFAAPWDPVASVAFLPDNRAALSGSWDKTLRLWDLASGNVIHTFTGHSDKVFSVAVSPDGRTALSGSLDKTLRLWDLNGF
jgi:hypothetical protein